MTFRWIRSHGLANAAQTCAYLLAFTLVTFDIAHTQSESAERRIANGIAIVSNDNALSRRIRKQVAVAQRQLETCGLLPVRDIRIKVVKTLTAHNGNPLASFHAATHTIELLEPGTFSRTIIPGSLYGRLPAKDLYDSLIVHEMAHAHLVQSATRNKQYLLAHEYISYALQFESLPPDVGQILRDHFPQDHPVDPQELNLFTARTAPIRFGVKAFLHFTQPGNGCKTLKAISMGTPIFPSAHGGE